MDSEKPFLRLKVDWQDESMFELTVSASNTIFCGKASLYALPSDLLKFAGQLKGFPHRRETLFYEEGRTGNNGYFSMRYYPVGYNGHVGVEINLESNLLGDYREEEKDRVKLEIIVEPGSIDKFQKELYNLAETESGIATLYG